MNLRDIGGYQTADGTRIRHGAIFRSSEWSRMYPQEKKLLAEIPLQIVFDLRSNQERQRGSVPGFQGELCVVNIAHYQPEWLTDLTLLCKGKLYEKQDLEIKSIYAEFCLQHASKVKFIIRTLLDTQKLPVLIHCREGKDRSGLVIAILMGILGVSEKSIVEEYLKSETTRKLFAKYRPFSRPKAEYIGALLKTINQRYTSFQNYAEEELGLDKSECEQLKALLLEY